MRHEILRRHLRKLALVKRTRHHPLIHKLHKKHKISRGTLFYIKEYGSHSNIIHTIIRESLKIILLASVVSSLGGLTLEQIKSIFIPLLPLVILLPSLNGMIGGYGTIISSKVATMLYEGIKKDSFKRQIKKLFFQILIIATLYMILSYGFALVFSNLLGVRLSLAAALKILFIVVFDVLAVVTFLLIVSVKAGVLIYKNGEDPSNFLIPITTAIADFANMILLAVLIIIFF